MIFLGGLCMYLNDADVIVLLSSLKNRLTEGGSIILRESTIRQGVSLVTRCVSGRLPKCEPVSSIAQGRGLLSRGSAAELRLHQYGDCRGVG